jgi:hypothetical protein
VENARRRGIRHVIRATLDDLGTLPTAVAAVGLFDVVEHIRHDAAFLAKVNRLMVPQGKVYITVPAYGWLWSHEDIVAEHFRRYTLRTLTRLLDNAGYDVAFATYIFGFLPLPVFLRRVLPYRLGFAPNAAPSADAVRSDHQPRSILVSRMLEKLTARELSRITARSPLAWGGSCLAVATKR